MSDREKVSLQECIDIIEEALKKHKEELERVAVVLKNHNKELIQIQNDLASLKVDGEFTNTRLQTVEETLRIVWNKRKQASDEVKNYCKEVKEQKSAETPMYTVAIYNSKTNKLKFLEQRFGNFTEDGKVSFSFDVQFSVLEYLKEEEKDVANEQQN